MRLLDRGRDRDAVFRIYREIGWAEPDQGEAFDALLGASRALVSDVNGSPECMVLSVPGAITYQGETLSFSGINGVTTGRVARKLGLAQSLTAETVARAADDGAAVVGLGMFEQGFYNQFGFGVGSYMHIVSFDPADLLVQRSPGVPVRLSEEHITEMHQARLKRMHWHGMVDIWPEGITKAECLFAKNAFGLGFRDSEGELTHCFWCETRGDHGPYDVRWMAYRNWGQFLDLLALLKGLGDQVHLIHVGEPPGIQLQDLVRKPLKAERIRRRSDFPAGIRAAGYWQVRICDLQACLKATHLSGATLRYNLVLDDPVVTRLPERAGWRGIAGEYTVTMGQESDLRPGHSPGLPVLRATVNAFSRMWLGVRPASGLAVTDDLAAPDELLARLDQLVRLPEPQVDWDV